MSRVYIFLLGVASLAVAVIGATFSVTGLAKLFAGSPITVGIMAASLEFSKLVAAGFLYRYWGHINRMMRNYLCFALMVLVCITSMGIWGFLTNAYQISSMGLKTKMYKMEGLKAENERIQAQIKEMKAFVESVPQSHISKKLALYQETQPKLKALNQRSQEIYTDIQSLQLDVLETGSKVGPLIYVAEALGVDVDLVARYLILLFVSVFDPLAITLVFAMNLAMAVHVKYRGREDKIFARHLDAAPVDHRYKRLKAAHDRLKRLKRLKAAAVAADGDPRFKRAKPNAVQTAAHPSKRFKKAS